MARRQDEFSVKQPLELAYDSVRSAFTRQGWITTQAARPAEVKLRPGPSQLEGSGRVTVALSSEGESGTRVTIEVRRALSDQRATAAPRCLALDLGLEFASLSDPIPGRHERQAVRSLVVVLGILAALAFILVPVPQNGSGMDELPAVALGQISLYRLEVALVAFYGGLLLITPVMAALARGRLPTEISAKGAKFADEVQETAKITQEKLDQQATQIAELESSGLEARLHIDQLAQKTETELRS
jgi:hypothetical protein